MYLVNLSLFFSYAIYIILCLLSPSNINTVIPRADDGHKLFIFVSRLCPLCPFYLGYQNQYLILCLTKLVACGRLSIFCLV